MDFAVFPWRFTLVAQEPVFFPPAKAANVLRGGFGTAFRRVACTPSCSGARECTQRHTCPYARIFEPTADPAAHAGPSGFADHPRPFVFRAAHLDAQSLASGQTFSFDLHVFLRSNPELTAFRNTLTELAREGLGATRGKAELQSVWQLDANYQPQADITTANAAPGPVILSTEPPSSPATELRIDFLTPTELKSSEGVASRPEFWIVFNRARDRVATLSALYGAGPLDLPFRSMGHRAEAIQMTHCEVRHMEAERRSSRTGQRHSLGGFVGEAFYEGDLTAFIPLLRAAEWTGIGRHTVWGKGQIRCRPARP